MIKVFSLSRVLVLVMAFILAACGAIDNNKNNENITEGDVTVRNQELVKIKLTFNNEEVIVNMYENPTSKDFLTLLPLTLTLEDYAATEKISYLDRKLSTKDAPSGTNGSVGDFTYYSPWGNLAIFYKDFGHANGLISIGKIESGVEKLKSINGKFTVTIEKME
ncbi:MULTISPECIES: cyclophilin-like fold protein [unclassified Bacillus (in: firmicutes)]|uniref:cyclophilin-like fold protein n=1 Tax=unclassified Bacillus (in: firmicutes) TaxID=185979 RepID=UPI002036223B|nr:MULTISPECIES: cyclophilin-like fold protein [unclassified Bacillus (in: firmicutes)]